MDIRKVKKLIELMEESDIHEIEIKEGEDGVRITRSAPGQIQQVASVAPAQAQPAPSAEDKKPVQHSGHILAAPMVGTFYLATSPSSPPFVQIGDRIKVGDTLCIIESMKMMNQIKSDRDGRLEAVLVENEQAVEYDQALFTIV